MSFRKASCVILSLFILTMLTSCGGNNPGGGTSEFKTTIISAAAKTTRLESDILTGNTCTNGDSSGGTFSTDNVDFSFTSTLYPGITSGSPVSIDSYTVTFQPNASMSTSIPPALPSISGSLIVQSIGPAGTLTVPVAVATEAMKLTMVSNNTLPTCSGNVFAYYALVTFSAIEVRTGTRNTIGPVSLDVVFADRQ